MKLLSRFLSWFPLLLLSVPLYSQTLVLRNPSLEGRAGFASVPSDWYYCGAFAETPPDLHPAGYFGVNLTPHTGHTYAGLVARRHGTVEGLGQLLTTPLAAGRCYSLRLWAARSATFLSATRVELTNFTDFSGGLRIRLWGGRHNCERQQLLTETDVITSTEWQEVSLSFQTDTEIAQLFFEAYYATEDSMYNGHVLIDDISPIIATDCAAASTWADSIEQWAPTSLPPMQLAQAFVHQLGPTPTNLSWTAFYTADGRLRQGNRELYALLQAKGEPSSRLIFYIRHPSKVRREAFARELINHLINLGLSPEQVTLQIGRKRRARGSGWLSAEADAAVWIRLQ